MKTTSFLVACVLLSCFLGACHGGNLRKNFYRNSCPQAEAIVKTKIQQHVAARPELPAKLIRMHFHDCFVRGCDGSVLLDSTATSKAEKDSIPNLSLAGYDVIDDIKAAIEAKCSGIVSCADILALATRDAFSVRFNNVPLWEVLTGRRDGRVSIASEALANLPPPFFNFTQLKQSFESKKLTVHDLVVLSGAHTIGVGHCNLFSNRLFNFTGKGDQDPSLNPTYADFLKTKCQGPSDTTTTVELDPNGSTKFDNDYYNILVQNKGLFQSDAALLTTKTSRNIVNELRNQNKFYTEFGQSMRRMGAIEVLTGSAGEIRHKCSVVNSN
ncbi:peroxidase 3-like [Arachis duranensis]|uniref:Peroxidase n=1 Tax=Arachis duranensis TaxID=130453 RepID=A0A6P4DSW9_ARADU|nr:peroxidase 3-like [Arachis duranensis]